MRATKIFDVICHMIFCIGGIGATCVECEAKYCIIAKAPITMCACLPYKRPEEHACAKNVLSSDSAWDSACVQRTLADDVFARRDRYGAY